MRVLFPSKPWTEDKNRPFSSVANPQSAWVLWEAVNMLESGSG